MADSYTQFSESIPGLTDVEAGWIKSQLDFKTDPADLATGRYCEVYDLIAAAAEVDDGDGEAIRHLSAELGYAWAPPPSVFENGSVDFNWTIDVGDDSKSLAIYANESGGIVQVAAFVKAFLSQFRPDDMFTLTWAGTCDKLLPGEFGGVAIAVTKYGHVSTNTWTWAERMKEFHEAGKELKDADA